MRHKDVTYALLDRPMRVSEVAAALDVHPETVRRWIHRKRIKAFKLGGSWRVYPDSIREWLEKLQEEDAALHGLTRGPTPFRPEGF